MFVSTKVYSLLHRNVAGCKLEITSVNRLSKAFRSVHND